MTGELERVRKALRELGKTLKSMSSDPPPQEVHRLRTATRRVEAIAAVLPPGVHNKARRLLGSIEPVRKAAGDVRDMDVLIANARKLTRYTTGDSLARLVEQLQIARKQYVTELLRTLGHRRKSTRDDLKQYSKLVKSALRPAKSAPPRPGQNGRPHEEVLSAAIGIVRELGDWPPLDASNIHAFRIKVKELRYILQLYADADPVFVDELGGVQRRIGDWHDWQQLAEIAHEILHPEQDSALIARIDQTAKRKFNRALASANALRGRHLAMPLVQGI